MTLDTFLEYCLNKPVVTESLPFGPDVLVLKVAGKMFALTGLDEVDFRINLKCDPERAVQLREAYPDVVVPGYHMSKKHWNTLYVEQGNMKDALVRELIDHSYDLVVASLTRKVKKEHGLA